MRFMEASKSAAVLEALSAAAVVIDLDTVRRDLDRATEDAQTNPEDGDYGGVLHRRERMSPDPR